MYEELLFGESIWFGWAFLVFINILAVKMARFISPFFVVVYFILAYNMIQTLGDTTSIVVAVSLPVISLVIMASR